VLFLLKEENLVICDYKIINGNDDHLIKTGTIKLEDILNNKEYQFFRKLLANKNILSLEQCIETLETKFLMETRNNNDIIKGKIPK
jgi:hypothetical protein